MVAKVAEPNMVESMIDPCPLRDILDSGKPFIEKIRRLNFVSHNVLSHISDIMSSMGINIPLHHRHPGSAGARFFGDPLKPVVDHSCVFLLPFEIAPEFLGMWMGTQ